MKILPLPTWLATATSPPDCLANPNTCDRPVAGLLGREERFEDSFELIRRNTAAGIGDGYGHIAIGILRQGRGVGQAGRHSHRNRQPSTALHGVPRVHGHVDDGGFELAGVGVDEARFFRAEDDDLDARTDQGADHFGQRLHASPDLEHLRLQRLPPCEGQQLPGQLGGAGHRIRDRLDIAQSPRLRQVGPPQQVYRSADHREQIVEVMRDAAGELAQRLQPLAVLQCFLGRLPLLGLEMKMPRPAQGQSQQGKQQRGGRCAEDQMLAHGGQPARAYRRGLEAGADIERVFGEPPVAEAALDAVGRRRHGDEAGCWIGGDYFPDRTPGVETDVAVDGGETRQHGAVRAAEREVAAGLAADPGVVILEIFREHGSLQHAAEAAVLARAPSADAEKRSALIGRPRLQRFTDKGSDIAGHVGPEIVPVGKIDLRRRHDQAVDEGVALGVENPGRLHLRQ